MSVGQLMIVGTPSYEPWHFTAHLADEAARWGRPDLAPMLMRWRIPEDAPGHLAVSVDEIAHASRSATVLVIPDSDDEELIERVSDAHRRGARVMSIEREFSGLAEFSHEHLTVDGQRSDYEYDLSQHLVTAIAPMD
jgi:hypothetical protein